MSDRALITFRKGDNFSPYICLRQGGSRALNYLKNAVISFRMGEVCDVYQIAALFVAFLALKHPDPAVLGIMDGPQAIHGDDLAGDRTNPAAWSPVRWLRDMAGDNQVFVVDIESWKAINYSRPLRGEKTGREEEPLVHEFDLNIPWSSISNLKDKPKYISDAALDVEVRDSVIDVFERENFQ